MDVQNSVGFTIRTLSNLLRRKFVYPEKSLNCHCSETSGLIMCYLCEHPNSELCQHDIEHVFCIRRSTTSRFLTMLEECGLVERHSAPNDARRKLIVPTPKALSIYAQILQRQEELEDCITENISPEELHVFLKVSRKIEANLSK